MSRVPAHYREHVGAAPSQPGQPGHGQHSPTGVAGPGPWTWTVTWGSILRPGLAVEHVVAWDADEALVLAAQRRPELPRPRVAFLASS